MPWGRPGSRDGISGFRQARLTAANYRFPLASPLEPVPEALEPLPPPALLDEVPGMLGTDGAGDGARGGGGSMAGGEGGGGGMAEGADICGITVGPRIPSCAQA
jgi:hypothetical protein